MIASPPSRHSLENPDMAMSAEAVGSSSTSAAEAASTSSPAYSTNNMMHAHSQQQQQQSFNIESFDFGADFSLQTSLDELTLFHQQQQRNTAQSLEGQSSNVEMAESPRNLNFSPRHMMGEQQQQQQHLQNTGASHTDSPHTLSNKGEDGASVSNASNTSQLNNVDLHNLLRAVQSSSMQQQQQQHPHPSHQMPLNHSNAENGANMSLSEMEAYLMEKEHAERMQTLQTALLRQQLESLHRQQSSKPADANQPSALPVNASHLMQQYQQLMAQQNASTPTPQSMHRAASFHQQPQHGLPDASAFASQKGNQSSLSQYGLITPLTSNAFVHTHQGTLPFVSPIHLPSSSQMEAHRSYDPNYTPLESPAVTPASVFSNIGSGNTTAYSQDFFSPLTSPALRPQMGNISGEEMMQPLSSPYLGPMVPRGQIRGRGSRDSVPVGSISKKKTTTPSASPAIVATKSVPRKNRSTTAEARANRARPSPLIKPTAATTAPSSRKRGDSSTLTSALASPLAMAIINGDSSPHKVAQMKRASQTEGSKIMTAFPPLHAGTAPARPLGASPSDEGASTTPSPIDLNASSSGKPMTPASIMGMDGRNSQKAKSRNSDQGKQVSFAASKDGNSSTASLQSILPGGFTSANGEGCLSNKSSSGGSSGGGGGGGGLESRRTSHKAAEQKRRDSLKYCFDELRGMLPAITLDEDAPGGSSLGPDGFMEDQEEEEFAIEEVGDEESARHANRAISKVALLRHSNEYLIRLKHRLARRDRDLDFCRKQVMELRSQLGYPLESQEGGILAQNLHPIDMDHSHFAASHNGTHHYNGNSQMDIS